MEDGSGHPVKVKDNSNFNRIEDNEFYKVGIGYLFRGYFCLGPTCTSVQCPSWGNYLIGNRLDGTANCTKQIAEVMLHHPEITAANLDKVGCVLPKNPYRTAMKVELRVIAGANTQSATPCEYLR